MARNGKVRKQAPKVDKQERAKKHVVGRAKKRQIYERRVLKADPGDKRKRGPNAGSGRKEEAIKKWVTLSALWSFSSMTDPDARSPAAVNKVLQWLKAGTMFLQLDTLI